MWKTCAFQTEIRMWQLNLASFEMQIIALQEIFIARFLQTRKLSSYCNWWLLWGHTVPLAAGNHHANNVTMTKGQKNWFYPFQVSKKPAWFSLQQSTECEAVKVSCLSDTLNRQMFAVSNYFFWQWMWGGRDTTKEIARSFLKWVTDAKSPSTSWIHTTSTLYTIDISVL